MINKRIKSLRTECVMTQKELADKLRLTPKMISFYELGERVPPPDILLKLSDIFNVSVDYLLGKTDTKTTQQVKDTAELIHDFLVDKLGREPTAEELQGFDQFADVYIKSLDK
jgi:Predicted transcriptional regulators